MKNSQFKPGSIWTDTDSRIIQAHGGGILYNKGRYYWFGENKGGDTLPGNRVDVIGVSCYSSRDLYNWENKGIVLPAVTHDIGHDLHSSAILERPKVIYNDITGRYVMWMHIDKVDYRYARAGVAISDRPEGPYEYFGSINPNGCDSRDMTVFKDDDGKAYIIYSSEWNSSIHISQLTPDYTAVEDEYSSHFESTAMHGSRESPAIFKNNGRYYMISSGCTGWDSNAAEYAVSESITGPWSVKGNPCIGRNAEKTFDSQSTFVLKVPHKRNSFIFMADRWNKDNLADSRYVWLPLLFKDGKPVIEWMNGWKL